MIAVTGHDTHRNDNSVATSDATPQTTIVAFVNVEPVPSPDAACGILNSGDQAANLQVRKGFAPGIDVARSIRHATQATLTKFKVLRRMKTARNFVAASFVAEQNTLILCGH